MTNPDKREAGFEIWKLVLLWDLGFGIWSVS